MALDFNLSEDLKKVKLSDTQIYKAGNILSVQKGSLRHDKEIGVDRDYFLNSEIKFKKSAYFACQVRELIFQNVSIVNYMDVENKDFVAGLKIIIQPAVGNKGNGGLF
jgi:ribosomal protein L27